MPEVKRRFTSQLNINELNTELERAMKSEDRATRRMILQPGNRLAEAAQERAINRQRELLQRLNTIKKRVSAQKKVQ